MTAVGASSSRRQFACFDAPRRRGLDGETAGAPASASTVPDVVRCSVEQATDMTDQRELLIRWTGLSVLIGTNDRTLGRLAQQLAAPPQFRGRPWSLPLRRRLLLTAAALRTNLTTRQLAAVFEVSQSMVQRVITDITRRFAAPGLARPTSHGGAASRPWSELSSPFTTTTG